MIDKEDIIRMAREAGIRLASQSDTVDPRNVYSHEIERFANLVAAHEREECAKVCEKVDGRITHYRAPDCAVAIRARGEK